MSRPTGHTMQIAESRCDYCKATIYHVVEVMTLRATRDDPAEYAWTCPECGGQDSWTEIPETEKESDDA